MGETHRKQRVTLMEHPSTTRREYDIFIERWLQTQGDDYTLDDIADAWEYYQETGRLSRPEGEPIRHASKSPPSSRGTSSRSPKSTEKGSRSPKNAEKSPEGGCGKKPNVEEYVRVVDSLSVEMDESHNSFTLAAMKVNGDSGLLVRIEPRSVLLVEITRTILGLGEGRLRVRSKPRVERHERVDVLPLVTTYLKPFLSGKGAVVNLVLENRAYRNRRCSIEQTRDSMRRDMISELSTVLTRSREEVLEMLRDPSSILLAPDKRARVDLYIAVKKGTVNTFTEPLRTLAAMYTTLGGKL